MATKYFCDRCEKEIHISSITHGEADYQCICLNPADSEDFLHLCLSCWGKLLEFLELNLIDPDY